jgi:hypothetical protein
LRDQSALEQRGRLVFAFFGGGDNLSSTDRLASLGQREFHF